MTNSPLQIHLARHGETAWSISGQHTGLTDIPLTQAGERNAVRLGESLQGIAFDLVLTSPLHRALRTCELAGYGDVAAAEPDIVEWNYGDYEGQTTAQIREYNPGWDLFRDGCPGGESPEDIGTRADRVVDKLRSSTGNALLFSHGHFLRVLAARWIGLAPSGGRYFYLSTAAHSILGFEHGQADPVFRLWNDIHHTVN